MPAKKKPVFDDDDFSDQDFEEPIKKPEKKRATIRKTSPNKQKTAIPSDLPGDQNEEIPPPPGYSGKYDRNSLLSVAIPEPPQPIMCADGTGSRLMIKEIIVTNFKSYYGRQIIGPFHKNFSAIIGPNGSGKSNVIDALLFVFGFRASRIRLKKLKELIHNSSGKQRPDFCSVEVAFQKIIDTNDGGFTVVDKSDFRVGRTAYQDSTSKYTINGKTKSKDEIETKLKSVGIDLVHNRFLILQGEVEQIALMKCKADGPGKEGMLEYLEDIIGSSRLNSFIHDIGLRIDEINTEKSQQNQKVKAAEREKEALEGPVCETLSHLRCENQATLITNKLLSIRKWKYEKDLQEIQPKKEVMKEDLDKFTARMDEILAKKKEDEKVFVSMETEKDKAQTRLAKTQKTIVDVETKEARRKIDHKKCVKDMKNAGDKLKSLEQELEEIKKVPEEAERIIKMKKGEIDEQTELAAKSEHMKVKNDKVYHEKSQHLIEAKAEAEQVKGAKQEILNEIEKRRRVAETELNLLQADTEKHANRMDELQNQLQDSRKQLDIKIKELDHVKTRIPECVKQLSEARKNTENINLQVKKLGDEENMLNGQRAKYQSAVNSNSSDLSKNVSDAGRILMKAYEDGKIKTFYGRLGDLATIDDKYQTAVSQTTANLDGWVFQTKRDCDMGLELIKQARCGRHSFFALDSLVPNRTMDQRSNLPAPRVFDLLQISKPEFRKAFYTVFGDTMIVDTMEQARSHYNKHRARYITMNGGVMDTSGTITGGGKATNRKALGVSGQSDANAAVAAREYKDASEQLTKVDAELLKINNKKRELKEKYHESEQKVFQSQKEENSLRATMRALEIDIDNLNTRIPNLEKTISQLKETLNKSKVNMAKIEEKREELKAINTEYEKAKPEFDEAEVEYQKCNGILQKVYQELIGRFVDAIDKANGAIAKYKNEINVESMKLNTYERDMTKIQSKVDGAKVIIESKEKDLHHLAREEEINEQALTQLMEKKKEYEDEVSEIDTRLKEARKNNVRNDEEENELKKEIDKLSDEFKTLCDKIHSIEYSITKVAGEISQLKLNRIKDFGILPEKIRKPAQHDHMIDEETLAEERAHQKKIKKKKVEEDEEEVESTEGDDGAVPVLTEEELQEYDTDELKFRLQQLQDKIRRNKERVNRKVIDEYTEKMKKYNAELVILSRLQETHKAHSNKMEEWKRHRLSEFMEGFTEIGKNLKEMYQMITLGGDASLDLKDSLDPFSEGIQFMVRPPKKSWKNIENLSGGEKTLSSLSLVFALHRYRPTPLYVMDEIDAALDFRNVSIIGHYVKEKTKNAQFIIISLRNNMFELGDRLVGIYKTNDCTKNVVIDPALVLDQALPVRDAINKIHTLEQEQVSMILSPKKDKETNENEEITGISENNRKRLSYEEAADDAIKRLDLRASPTTDPHRVSRLRSIDQEAE